jgi:hypothetical protein
MSAKTSPLASEVMMKSVKLLLPEEIVRDADLPYEGLRDVSAIELAIEGINFTASIVTLVTIKTYAPQLAAAIRRWRLKQDRTPRTLTVKGDGMSLRIDLPPNVSKQEILNQLAPLLDGDTD